MEVRESPMMMKNAAELELCTLALVALRFFVGDLIAPSALSQLGFLVMHMLMETQLECFRVCVLCFMFSFVVCVFYVISLSWGRRPASFLLYFPSLFLCLSFFFIIGRRTDRDFDLTKNVGSFECWINVVLVSLACSLVHTVCMIASKEQVRI